MENRRWWYVGGGIAIIIVACIACVFIAGLGWWAWTSPDLGLNCRAASDAYLKHIEPDVREFRDAANLASSASFLSAPSQIERMQRLIRSVEAVPAPACAKTDASDMISGMRGITTGFLNIMAESEDKTKLDAIRLQHAESVLRMAGGIDALAARSNRTTPVAFDRALVAKWQTIASGATITPTTN